MSTADDYFKYIPGKTKTKNLELFLPVTSSDKSLLQIKTKLQITSLFTTNYDKGLLQITTALKITNYEPGVDPKGGVVQLYDGLGG